MKNIFLFISAGLLIPALASAKSLGASQRSMLYSGLQQVQVDLLNLKELLSHFSMATTSPHSVVSASATSSVSPEWPTVEGCGKVTQGGVYSGGGEVEYWDPQSAQWQYKWEGQNMLPLKLTLSNINSQINVTVNYGTDANNLDLNMATRTLPYASPYGAHSAVLGYYLPVIENQRYYYRIAVQNVSSTFEYIPSLAQSPCTFFAKLYTPN